MAIYVDNIGDTSLPVTINNPKEGESLVWDPTAGAFVNAPQSSSAEVIQDTVAEMLEVDPAGSNLSLRLVSNYDDVTGKITFNVVTDAGTGSGSGPSSLIIKENGATRGVATTLNFAGASIGMNNGVATITGLLDKIKISDTGINFGDVTKFDFRGFDLTIIDDTLQVVAPDLSTLATRTYVDSAIANVGGNYTLPTASTSVLGGIKVGSGLAIDNQGVLTTTATGYVTATEVNNAITAATSSLASTAYVATQIANIQPVNLSNYATTSYVNTQISSVLDGAPAALDTLKEIATALGNNATFADTIAASLATKASQSYVDAQLETKVSQYELTAAVSATSTTLTNYVNSAIAGIPTYALPTASASTLGGVKVGTGLAINSQGELNVTFTPTTSLPWSSITDKPALFSGSYADLTNKPTFATVATSGSYTDLSNKPTLFSGSYTDLSNKPSIPSLVGYATESYVNQQLSSLNLEDLTDTYVTGVTDGQALVWSQSNLRWQPGDISSGGSGNYTLPTASTSVLGGVKVDGTSITISNGVISAVGGGSGGGVTLTDVGTYLNNNGYVTQTYVQGQIDNLINGAPGTLNTLQELAAAIASNPNFATDLTSTLSGKLNISGGTMTGALTLSGAPTTDLQAATKKYVDDIIALIPTPSTNLDALTDVNTTGVATGQLLGWNGTAWVPTNNSGVKGDTGPAGAKGDTGSAGLSISAATVTLAGRLQLTLTDNSVVDAGNVSGIKSALVNGSGELILTKQDNTTVNAGSVIGPQGTTGAQGIQGIKGDTGTQGPAGLSVSAAAVNGSGRLIITRSDSSIIDAGNVIGAKGDTGDSATITVGAIATGAAGTNVLVTNTGTANAATLNFTIPKGDTGLGIYSAVVNSSGNLIITLNDSSTIDAGSTVGPQGPQGAKGDTGLSIISGTISGDDLVLTKSDNTTINVGNVRGLKGDTGAKGDTGDTGTISIGSVTTGAVGSSVIVTNSGTSTAATLDFTIPQGAKGDTGTSYTVNNKAGSVQVYGIGNTTQPGYDLEVDLANKANKWTTARTLTLSGKVTGLTTFDGSGNITMTTALNAVTTNDITEGVTNKYYTDARARTALSSISDGNITSLISYDDTTGQIKYRASTSYIAEGGNLYFTNTRADTRADTRIAASSINALADVDTTTTAPTNGQVLTWTGSAWTPSSVAGGSGAISSVNAKTGIVVLNTDDVSEGSTNQYYTNTRWDNRLAAKTTDNLNQGTTNKYFSDTLARNALAAGTGLSYNSSSGTFSINASTDNVSEGSSNLYYTTARFDTRLGQSNLNAFADVANTTPTNGQALAWNGSAWAPTTISGGGGGSSSSGVFRAAVQVEYDASGNLASVAVLNGGISAVIATATSTVATVVFTFTGSVCAPLNTQVYSYQRATNSYVLTSVTSTFTAGRTLAGGGSSGSPSAFSAFDPAVNTMTIGLPKSVTGASAGVGQTTHCVVQFLLSSV